MWLNRKTHHFVPILDFLVGSSYMDQYRVSLRSDMAGLGYDLLSLELVGFDYTDSASEFRPVSPKVDSLHLTALENHG